MNEFFKACHRSDGVASKMVENTFQWLNPTQLSELLKYYDKNDEDKPTAFDAAIYGGNTAIIEVICKIKSAVLDRCKKVYIPDDGNPRGTLQECFSEFIPNNDDRERSFHKKNRWHPLTVIGQTKNLSLILHPYVQMYVDICWDSLVRYVFYTHLFLFALFLFFLCSFVTSHNFIHNSTVTLGDGYNMPFSKFTTASAYITITLAVCGLLFEALQLHTKGKDYWKWVENLIDLVIFLGSGALCIVSLVTNYNTLLHGLGCILIIIAALRGALILTHIPLHGYKFRMLLNITKHILQFGPVLLFFILTFAVVFKNLLQNQDSFSHVGFSMVKVLVMSIGELEFENTFFTNQNEESLEVLAYLAFVIFLGIMSISMMNLLIGLAVGDMADLRKEAEVLTFRSKVDLILQYSYMYPLKWISVKQHKRTIQKIKMWHIMEDSDEWHTKLRNIFLSPFGLYTEWNASKFTEYQNKLNKKYQEALSSESTQNQTTMKTIMRNQEEIKQRLETLEWKISRPN